MLDKTKKRMRMRKTASMCKFKRGDKVLDVGCGDEILSDFLSQSIDYTGIDKKDIDLNEGKLPYKSNSFDCVFCLEVLEHIHRPFDLLKEMGRISRGSVVISVPNPYYLFDFLYHLFSYNNSLDDGHIYSFTSFNLNLMFRKLGLSVVAKNGLWFGRYQIFHLKITPEEGRT